MSQLPYSYFTSPTSKSHPFICLSFSVCAQGTASAFLPKNHLPKLSSSGDQRGEGAGRICCPPRQDAAPQLILQVAGQQPDLLASGALDPSGSWGFGLPTADYSSLMLNSSAGKSAPEPPESATAQKPWAGQPCLAELQQHSTHSPAPDSVRIQQQQRPA